MSNENVEINYFRRLQTVDCRAHIETKGGLSYLSWPFAVAELKARYPDATWKVRHYQAADGEPRLIPYCQTEAGAFVCVEVTVNGVTHEQIHPVLDHKNKTVKNPDAFQINTSIMRCLVKCIALHGLGLYIYAGEDLPIENAQDADERDAKHLLWENKIASCADEAVKSIREEMIAAYGGRENVPALLVERWKQRVAAVKSKLDSAAESVA
jgi:hypothetical protein